KQNRSGPESGLPDGWKRRGIARNGPAKEGGDRMRFLSVLLGVLLMTATSAPASASQGEETEPQWRLVIHGGAGVIERSRMTPAEDEAIRAALNRALDAGSAILARG